MTFDTTQPRMIGYGWSVGDRPEGPKKCPRCGGWIPNNETPGAYPGAMSRYLVPIDGELRRCIEICSACGEHEAFQQMNWARQGAEQTGLTPPHDWPIQGLLEENLARAQERREAFEQYERLRAVEEESETDAILRMGDGKELRMQSSRPQVEYPEGDDGAV